MKFFSSPRKSGALGKGPSLGWNSQSLGVCPRWGWRVGAPLWREGGANGHIFHVKINFWALQAVVVDEEQSPNY